MDHVIITGSRDVGHGRWRKFIFERLESVIHAYYFFRFRSSVFFYISFACQIPDGGQYWR